MFVQQYNFYLGKMEKKISLVQGTERTGCYAVMGDERRLTNDSMGIKVCAKGSSRRLVEYKQGPFGRRPPYSDDPDSMTLHSRQQ